MSDDFSRRDLLRTVAVSATLGTLTADAAQHVHHVAAEEKKAAGVYKPKALNEHEYRTLQRLTDLIMPADGSSKSALEAGAPEFIDLLASQNDQMTAIYTGGIAWLDREMQRRHKADFVSSTPEQQAAMLDLIAFRENDSPALGPGIVFFDWVRKMTVDAYYTSKVGIADLGYKGNVGMTTFKIPEEAMQYALKKSGLE